MLPADTIHGSPRGSPDTAMTFARNIDARRLDQVERYLAEVYALAPRAGIDPAIVVAQSALETDNWRDRWWAERLNPAGLGITGDPVHNEGSRSWGSGADAARAQIVHLSLYARGKPLPPDLEPHAHLDPRRDAIAADVLGTRRTLASLGGFWAAVADYGQRICNRSQSVFLDVPNQRKESPMPLDIEVNIATNRIGEPLRDREAFITVHENGNPNSGARQEREFVVNGGGEGAVSYHFAVDRHRAVQILPLDSRGKHAGNATGNATSIAIETSQQEPETPNNQTQRNLRALLAAIIARDERLDFGRGGYEFSRDRIRFHRDWPGANPNCPERMLAAWNSIDPLMDGVKAALDQAIDIVSNMLAPHPVPGPHETKVIGGKVLWKIDEDVEASSEVRPKEWADPSARNAPDEAVIPAGQPVHVRYLIVGTDHQPWLITDLGWRMPANAFAPS
jgi:hypothetical protein